MPHYAFKKFQDRQTFDDYQKLNIEPLVIKPSKPSDAKLAQKITANDVMENMKKGFIAIAIYFNAQNEEMIAVCEKGKADIAEIVNNPQKYLRVTWHQIAPHKLRDLLAQLNAQIKPAVTSVSLPPRYHFLNTRHPSLANPDSALLPNGPKSDDSDDESCCSCLGR